MNQSTEKCWRMTCPHCGETVKSVICPACGELIRRNATPDNYVATSFENKRLRHALKRIWNIWLNTASTDATAGELAQIANDALKGSKNE